MVMKYFFTLLAASLVSGLLLTAPLSAADFAELGTIDKVDLKAGYLIVDDGQYALSPDVRVTSQDGRNVPLSSLQRGMKIAFNTGSPAASKRAGRGAITEVAILPSKSR
jgi:hypothetical protein